MPAIQKISYQIRSYHKIQKKTGKHAFGLQIVIDGNPRMIPIEVLWFADQFSNKSELFSYGYGNDELTRDLNLILAKEKSRANDIITRYRLTNRLMDHAQFKWEFANYASRDDVFEYFRARADKMEQDGEIVHHSRKIYTSCFARVREFHQNPLTFKDLNGGFVVRLDNHLRKTFAHNTVVGTHKVLKKMFRVAIKEGLLLENPYSTDKVKTNYVDGDREVLTPEELKRLIALFEPNELAKLSPGMVNVLEMYVFSATSGGYRFSELCTLNSSNIKFGILKMETVKGKRSGVTLKIDLPEIGRKIVENRKGKIFAKVTEQVANKYLKSLAGCAGINKHLTFHTARDTFGTLYTYFGGDITTLSKDVFKHKDIKTTMIYQKKSASMRKEDMNNFNVFSLP